MVIFLTSCDCAFDYKFEIYNNLNQNVTIKYKSGGPDEKIVTINPGVSEIIFSGEGNRCGCTNCQGSPNKTVDSTIYPFISGIAVFKNDTVQSLTDFNKEKNWEFESKKKLGLYKAYIDETDF